MLTPASTPCAPPAHILVIDDEPDLRTLHELTLLREAYRVEAAGDLAQARQQLRESRFNAVITDMRLPDGLGLELLREMVTQQRPERCVVITAHGSADNAVDALKAGAFDYLTKPVDLMQFRSVVASAIQATKAAPSGARLAPYGVIAQHPLPTGGKAKAPAPVHEKLHFHALNGNIRELENILHRAVALSEHGELRLEAQPQVVMDRQSKQAFFEPFFPAPAAAPVSVPENLQDYLDALECVVLNQVLQDTLFNRTAAAAKLGLSLRQIRYRIARLNIAMPYADVPEDRGDGAEDHA